MDKGKSETLNRAEEKEFLEDVFTLLFDVKARVDDLKIAVENCDAQNFSTEKTTRELQESLRKLADKSSSLDRMDTLALRLRQFMAKEDDKFAVLNRIEKRMEEAELERTAANRRTSIEDDACVNSSWKEAIEEKSEWEIVGDTVRITKSKKWLPVE